MPYDPCPGCDVYALSEASCLVDDPSFAWPEPSSGGDGGGAQWRPPASCGSGHLWLEITGVRNSLADLILHGTTAGSH